MNEPTQCQCDLWQKWHPFIRRMLARLKGQDLKLFKELLSQTDELDCANAKLNGTWPGWEWMKDAAKRQGTCEWRENARDGNWETGCKETHCFIDAGPKENKHKFCPYCGGKIKIVKP